MPRAGLWIPACQRNTHLLVARGIGPPAGLAITARRGAGPADGPSAPVQIAFDDAYQDTFFDEVFDRLPAWIISAVLHTVAMLLAGMWLVAPSQKILDHALHSISDEELDGNCFSKRRSSLRHLRTWAMSAWNRWSIWNRRANRR